MVHKVMSRSGIPGLIRIRLHIISPLSRMKTMKKKRRNVVVLSSLAFLCQEA
jgi:hypothetical protein